jgi:hypothetical protein
MEWALLLTALVTYQSHAVTEKGYDACQESKIAEERMQRIENRRAEAEYVDEDGELAAAMMFMLHKNFCEHPEQIEEFKKQIQDAMQFPTRSPPHIQASPQIKSHGLY